MSNSECTTCSGVQNGGNFYGHTKSNTGGVVGPNMGYGIIETGKNQGVNRFDDNGQNSTGNGENDGGLLSSLTKMLSGG